MNGGIENVVKSCVVCQESRPAPATAPLHSWEWPSEPWSRIHLDYTGPFLGQMYLVIVEAHSKWLNVQTITSARTIEKLRVVFATHGLPRKVVTNNGPSFTSEEFQSFMSANGITHILRATDSLKEPSRLSNEVSSAPQEIQFKLQISLYLSYYPTHNNRRFFGIIGRRPRSRFERLFPDMQKQVQQKRSKQAMPHDNSKPLRNIAVGDLVYTRDFSTPYCHMDPWICCESNWSSLVPHQTS